MKSKRNHSRQLLEGEQNCHITSNKMKISIVFDIIDSILTHVRLAIK